MQHVGYFKMGIRAGLIGLVLLFGGRGEVPGQVTGDRVGNPVSISLGEEDRIDCGLRKEDIDAFVDRRPDPRVKQREPDPSDSDPTASIEVDYNNLPEEARDAFARAVAIWERHIRSGVTIQISVSLEVMEPRALGGSVPGSLHPYDADSDGHSELFVVGPLADALTGEDQHPGNPDLFVAMNRTRDDWHFGPGAASSGMVDFTTVALHEIAHGLGYFALSEVADGEGAYGFDPNRNGIRKPVIFMTQLARKIGGEYVPITKLAGSNPSETLAEAFTSDEIVFDGPAATSTGFESDGPTLPKIYSPSRYLAGSSLSHLDEDTYPPEKSNSLMTPFINAAETNREPGPVLCGQLRDIGWSLGEECQQHLDDVFGLRMADQTDLSRGRAAIEWERKEGSDLSEYVIERKYFDESFEPIARVTEPSVILDSLGLGVHTMRVRGVRGDGSEATTSRSVQATIRPRKVEGTTLRRDDRGRASVQLEWTVPPGTKGFAYRVERRTGEGGLYAEEKIAAGRQTVLRQQSPGTYQYRVLAEDRQGNTVAGKTSEQLRIDYDGPVYTLGPYPNPTQETTTLDLTAQEAQSVVVEVFDLIGRRLYTERRELRADAATSLTLDARRWGSGGYILRVRGQSFMISRKITVVQ